MISPLPERRLVDAVNRDIAPVRRRLHLWRWDKLSRLEEFCRAGLRVDAGTTSPPHRICDGGHLMRGGVATAARDVPPTKELPDLRFGMNQLSGTRHRLQGAAWQNPDLHSFWGEVLRHSGEIDFHRQRRACQPEATRPQLPAMRFGLPHLVQGIREVRFIERHLYRKSGLEVPCRSTTPDPALGTKPARIPGQLEDRGVSAVGERGRPLRPCSKIPVPEADLFRAPAPRSRPREGVPPTATKCIVRNHIPMRLCRVKSNQIKIVS